MLSGRLRNEGEGVYVLCDLDSLVFTLKAVPLPESFDPARHCAGVNRLLRERSERGVETTEHRELLAARKPDNQPVADRSVEHAALARARGRG